MKLYSKYKSEIKQSDKKIENMKFSVRFLNKKNRCVWYQIVQNLVLNVMQTFISTINMNIDEINKKICTVYFTEIYKVLIQTMDDRSMDNTLVISRT